MFKYKAFISYKHDKRSNFSEDLEYALKMHGKPAWTQPYRVFRDEKYLVTGKPIGEQIRKALNESEYLVYLASPAAAASEWVQDELSQWIEDGPGAERLILAVTDGEIALNPNDKESLDLQRTNILPTHLAVKLAQPGLFVDFRDLDPRLPVGLDNPAFTSKVNAIVARLRDVAPAELMDRAIQEGRRQIQFRKRSIGALVVVASIATVAAVAAYLSAETARDNQRMAEARRIAATAEQVRAAEGNMQRAALLMVAALRWNGGASERVPGLLEAAHRVLDGLSGEVALELEDLVTAASFAPDMRLFVGTNRDTDAGFQAGLAVYEPDAHGTLQPLCQTELTQEAVQRVLPVPGTDRVFAVDDVVVWLIAATPERCETLRTWPNPVGRADVAVILDGTSRIAFSDDEALVMIDGDAGDVHTVSDLVDGKITSLIVSADGDALFVGGASDSLALPELPAPTLAQIGLGAEGLGAVEPLLGNAEAGERGLLGVSALESFAAGSDRYLVSGHSSGEVVLWQIQPSGASAVQGGTMAPPAQDLEEPANAVMAIAVMPDSQTLVTGHQDGTIGFWGIDLAGPTIEPRARFDLSDTRVRHLTVSEHDNMVLVAHREVVTSGRVLHLCPTDATAAAACRQLAGHEQGPIALRHEAAQNRFLSVAGLGKAVRSWAPALMQPRLTLGRFSGPEDHHLSPVASGDHLLVLPEDQGGVGTVLRNDGIRLGPLEPEAGSALWSGLAPRLASNGGQYILASMIDEPSKAVLVAPTGETTTLGSLPRGDPIALGPTGRWMAVVMAEGQTLGLYAVGSATPVVTLEFSTNVVDHVVFSKDGNTVVVGNDQGDVWLLRHQTASRWEATQLAEQIGDVRGLALNPDGTRLIAAGYEAVAWSWDLRNPSSAPLRYELGYQVRQITFSPDGRFLAAGTTSGTILLWDFAGWARWVDAPLSRLVDELPWRRWALPPPSELVGHDGDIADIAFSPDSRFLFSVSFSWTSSDNTLRLWPLDGTLTERYGEVLVRHEDWFSDVAVQNGGDVVFAALSGGTILAVPVTAEALASLARRFAGRDLTRRERLDYFTLAERGWLGTALGE